MKKEVCIFIGGATDINISAAYQFTAQELGKKLNERDYKIIFDGCAGLPSMVFNEIEGYNRSIICRTEKYTSDFIKKYYSGYNDISMKIDRTLDFKKQSEMTDALINLSDALVFMKGKAGTLEEIFRVLNGNKNKEYNKPVVILNINHEWDKLLNILDLCDVNDTYYVTNDIVDALNYIEKRLFIGPSDFNTIYVQQGYSKRIEPVIESSNNKNY